MEVLRNKIQELVKELFQTDVVVELTRPDEQFGDFSTNVAMKLAKDLGKNPREIAQELTNAIHEQLAEYVLEVAVAGPGFINLRLTDQTLLQLLDYKITQVYAGKQVVAEYSDPNPFKVLHAGHLYTSIVGDSIANLLEAAGGSVHRVNFGGDVGLHVGKTMWAILRYLRGGNPEKLGKINEDGRAAWMAGCYIEGTNAYDSSSVPGSDHQIKDDIVVLNKLIYSFWSDNPEIDFDWKLKTIIEDYEIKIDYEKLKEIYLTTRQWSYDYFIDFYARIGTKFEKYYPESEVAELGLRTVKEQLARGVYKESDGAVVFDGESHGLHTRVFINSEGLPTYEAKDVGLIMQKYTDYQFDKSVVITGNEQEQYMAVVLKSIEQFAPQLVQATSHLTHGIVKLAGGVKMSSRKGNILRAVDVLDVASEANKKATGSEDQEVVLGAVKYAFLKVRTGGDIIYDPEESVSLQGNSGPYLQYAHARARSILEKSEITEAALSDLQDGERSLLRKIGEYAEVVDKAAIELMPHHICTYLYELAQTFNRFYEHNRVIDDPRQGIRVHLVHLYADRLRDGLSLLGITAPDRM